MKQTSPVLVSWVARNNDPYERESGRQDFRIENGNYIPGPTLNILFDKESQYRNRIHDVVLFYREVPGNDGEKEKRVINETVSAIQEHESNIQVHPEPWKGADPTDHRSIFEFLQKKLPEIRQRYHGRELVLHISPGTPSMQTIWVLMAETGYVEPPFQLVKSYRHRERMGRPAVVPVDIGIDTFYKAYKVTHPSRLSGEEEAVFWDPAKFRTQQMRSLFIEARRFAQINVPVLILGERGTGKTTLAGWIRMHSPYRRAEQDKRWPTVACGQYIPETMRAELFGYKKDSFTGATKDKNGLLEAANHDTLFLDEVGDVSRDLQRLLIKALEEKQYYALGDDRPRHSDFRLLTATNLEPKQIKERLDPDFYDRISLLKLRLPPLREIPEELDWLWEDVYLRAARRAGISDRSALLGEPHHKRIIAHLKRHPLPSNLRDLFRIAYRTIAARQDAFTSLSPEESVDYGLEALKESETTLNSSEVSRTVARAFSDSSPLDSVIHTCGRLDVKAIGRELNSYLAEEIRRLSRDNHIPITEICDVSGRTLLTWSNGVQKDVWKKTSEPRRKSSKK